jgi:hypothetical protein
MEIVEKGTGYNSSWDQYVILKSKTGMKRDHWRLIESAATLDEIGRYFVRLQGYDKVYKDKFKYKVVFRHNTIKDTVVPSKEIMLLRIKHGF